MNVQQFYNVTPVYKGDKSREIQLSYRLRLMRFHCQFNLAHFTLSQPDVRHLIITLFVRTVQQIEKLSPRKSARHSITVRRQPI